MTKKKAQPSPTVTAYPPMTPTEAALELGVPLSQKLKPDFSRAVPKRHVSEEEAKARGWSWKYTGSDVCRYGHNAARRTSNTMICSDCERVKDNLEPIYGRSKTQKYYETPRRKPTDPSAPIVIQAPASAPAQVEPTKKEQEFLAALASTGDIGKAAEQTGFSRGQINAREAVNETFQKALAKLTDKLGIATRAPDAKSFPWTAEIEKQFAAHFVDCGLLEQVRQEMGVSASAYQERLQSSSKFAALIEDAIPMARLTLRDRATQAASVGKIDLLKFLEKDADENSVGNMSPEQQDAELTRLIEQLDKTNVFPRTLSYWRLSTNEVIRADDLREHETTHSRPASSDNSDLVSA
jgi:hypothetical protein